jgi:hypothetical protein
MFGVQHKLLLDIGSGGLFGGGGGGCYTVRLVFWQ